MSDTGSTAESSEELGMPAAPEPSDAVRALDRLVGTWRVTGGASGEVTYAWMSGGYFLTQQVRLEQFGQTIEGVEIIWAGSKGSPAKFVGTFDDRGISSRLGLLRSSEQKGAFDLVRGQLRCSPKVTRGACVIKALFEEVCPHRVGALAGERILGDPEVGIQLLEQLETDGRPEGVRGGDHTSQAHGSRRRVLPQQQVQADDLHPVRRPDVGRPAMYGGDRRLELVGTVVAKGPDAIDGGDPSSSNPRSHRVRSCSANGISSSAGPLRAGRRDSVNSINARRPTTSGSSGTDRTSFRVNLIASAAKSTRPSAAPAVAV